MNRLSMSALPSSITIESHFRSNKAVQMKQFLTFETRLVTVFFSLISSVKAQMAEEATVENAANDSLLWLALVTMLIAIGFAVWQLIKVRRAKRTREHSALSNTGTQAPENRDARKR